MDACGLAVPPSGTARNSQVQARAVSELLPAQAGSSFFLPVSPCGGRATASQQQHTLAAKAACCTVPWTVFIH